jgi:hypothetical protein
MADGAQENYNVGFISSDDGNVKGLSRKISTEDATFAMRWGIANI